MSIYRNNNSIPTAKHGGASEMLCGCFASPGNQKCVQDEVVSIKTEEILGENFP